LEGRLGKQLRGVLRAMNPRALAKAKVAPKRPSGEWVRGKKRGRRLLELFWANRGRCHYCGRGCILKPDSACDPLRATVDHLLPVARGGTNAWANLRLACFSCNTAKADKLPERQEDLLAIRDVYGMACIKGAIGGQNG
jgi:5-methylcytosine-specific restriction endonuclease McrA